MNTTKQNNTHPAPIGIDIGIDAEDRRIVAEGLTTVLADTYTLPRP